MAALPNYIPAAVVRNYAHFLNWNFGGSPEQQACFLRLIERPCMEKVWRSLEDHLISPTAWEWVIDRAVFYSDYQEWIDDQIRPDQKEVPRKLEQIRKSGEDLLAALDWLWDRDGRQHGYHPPADWGDLEHILRAERMGEKGRKLGELLYERAEFPQESSFGEYPRKLRMTLGRYTVQQVIRAVVDMHSAWQPGSNGGECEETGYSQKTGESGRAQMYVRIISRDLKEYCSNQPSIFPSPDSLPYGRLLSYDNLARLTRAALDLPDDPGPYRQPFNKDDVRHALKAMPG